MIKPNELLAYAIACVRRPPVHHRQAKLRRAVSTAYYALFHRLVQDAARLGGIHGSGEESIRSLFDHGTMKEACDKVRRDANDRLKALAAAGGPQSLRGAAPSGQARPSGTMFAALGERADLEGFVEVCSAFIDLQEHRHRADYDASGEFKHSDTVSWVAKCKAAFATWKRVRKSDAAKVFCMCLLAGKKPRR